MKEPPNKDERRMLISEEQSGLYNIINTVAITSNVLTIGLLRSCSSQHGSCAGSTAGEGAV